MLRGVDRDVAADMGRLLRIHSILFLVIAITNCALAQWWYVAFSSPILSVKTQILICMDEGEYFIGWNLPWLYATEPNVWVNEAFGDKDIISKESYLGYRTSLAPGFSTFFSDYFGSGRLLIHHRLIVSLGVIAVVLCWRKQLLRRFH